MPDFLAVFFSFLFFLDLRSQGKSRKITCLDRLTGNLEMFLNPVSGFISNTDQCVSKIAEKVMQLSGAICCKCNGTMINPVNQLKAWNNYVHV